MFRVTLYPHRPDAANYSWRTPLVIWNDHTVHFTTDDNKKVSLRGGTIIVEEE